MEFFFQMAVTFERVHTRILFIGAIDSARRDLQNPYLEIFLRGR